MAAKPANARRYQLVSVDDHVIEPPDVWETRLPAALRERGPRMQRTEKGEVWVIAGKRVRGIVGLGAMAGWRFEDYTPRNLSFQEIRRGCYDAKARLEDMDTDGVDAQVLFGTMVGFAGSVFIELAREDAELAHACVRAYNDWLASEWCAADPERLIPQCILPLWDLGAAHAELLRALALGHRAVLLPALPHALDLPALTDERWEPILSTCSAAGVPVALHIAGSMANRELASMMGKGLEPGSGVAGEALVATAPLSNFGVLAALIFSGLPVRYPDLRLVSVEGGIGWVPYFLERMDWIYTRHRFWTQSKLLELPSHYFKRQMYATFIVDGAGIDALKQIGVGNVMWESDYPHSDTTWPNSRRYIEEQMGSLSEPERHQVVAGNAVRLYGLAGRAH
jgi:predicted TIM-barrel fold metal-dependent hydrolase